MLSRWFFCRSVAELPRWGQPAPDNARSMAHRPAGFEFENRKWHDSAVKVEPLPWNRRSGRPKAATTVAEGSARGTWSPNNIRALEGRSKSVTMPAADMDWSALSGRERMNDRGPWALPTATMAPAFQARGFVGRARGAATRRV